MSRRSNWLIVLFESSTFLLIFCQLTLSFTERGDLMSPYIILDLSIPHFNFASCNLKLSFRYICI